MLTKDDIHILETLVDVQRGFINDRICKMCEIATHMEAFKKEVPFKKQIEEYQKSWERYKQISDKLQAMRLENAKTE